MFDAILFGGSLISFLFFVFNSWSYYPLAILILIALIREIRKSI